MGAYFLKKQARSPILEGFGRNIYALLSFSGQQYNLTLPTAIAQTNESGIATFVLPREEWFTTQSQRFLTFVVQEGGGPDNYQIWSSGKTVEAGKVVKVDIRLTQFPN